MRGIHLFPLLLLLASCSGKKRATADAAPARAAASPAPADAGRKPKTEFNVQCDRILPADLLAKYFPGGSLDPGNTTLEVWQRSCAISDPKAQVGTMVHVACGDPYVNDETIAQQKEQATRLGFETIPDVGRWAVRRADQLRMWDKDAPCFFTVHRFRDKAKLVEFARDLEAATSEADFDTPDDYKPKR